MASEPGRQVRVVLQARTSSSRQPAKSLLPLGGIPLAILCALRLSRAGTDLVLATTHDPSDDILAGLGERANLKVFRGSLSDVLSRFADCTADMADDDIVVRMTADNPVPDGEFVGLLVEEFLRCDADYLGTRWPEDGLPYGLGGEVFTAGGLRRAAASATTPYEREHVTPYFVENDTTAGAAVQTRLLGIDFSSRRCTIDTLSDYIAMARVFERIESPIDASWRSLLPVLPEGSNALSDMARVKKAGASGTRIVLGTAQFGMHYGIANRTGCPSDSELRSMLKLAAARGVSCLDTARGYGNAETRIGDLLASEVSENTKIITKLAPLDSLSATASAAEVHRAVDASVFRSCRELRLHRIEVLMFHRSADMQNWQGAALDRLAALVGGGVIGALGVSVYTPEEAIEGLGDPRIKHLQIPFNLLDARWLGSAFQTALKRRPDASIHVRSVFLQGLLINAPAVWPAWFDLGASLVGKIEQLRQELGRASAVGLCMAYVAAHPWVSTMVLGAESLGQLQELLDTASDPPLSPAEAEHVRASIPTVPNRLLNPAKW